MPDNELMIRIMDYAREHYGVEPDFPFPNYPDIPVLRHHGSRKWFAIFMNVSRSVLRLDGDDPVDIMNVKCDPILSGSLRMQEGYLPGYHMNHDQWLTILLDGTVPLEEIIPLLDMSFDLTFRLPKKRRKDAKDD
ncbi:MmcQ/YjbR family DNA-binding protein [Ruminococcus sp.]|uniref:MmcQ/YjbR family DNA-binding protein n=1 Tax=Ruminococcus sp. TaxID=41978 RepID=UPI002E816D2B|nr:MmcQ/YjbR family DNA-binding protein [Ruminococcus sp.]MEE3493066.1 MmcQ/YjbR family DNA-binding protein [Ruminococcus sp.]